MSKKWTIEEAKAYITKVQKGKQQIGLTYWSAVDFIAKSNQPKPKIRIEDIAESDN